MPSANGRVGLEMAHKIGMLAIVVIKPLTHGRDEKPVFH
jgi:hypothetical protein